MGARGWHVLGTPRPPAGAAPSAGRCPARPARNGTGPHMLSRWPPAPSPRPALQPAAWPAGGIPAGSTSTVRDEEPACQAQGEAVPDPRCSAVAWDPRTCGFANSSPVTPCCTTAAFPGMFRANTGTSRSMACGEIGKVNTLPGGAQEARSQAQS